jgi:hypothetical protein
MAGGTERAAWRGQTRAWLGPLAVVALVARCGGGQAAPTNDGGGLGGGGGGTAGTGAGGGSGGTAGTGSGGAATGGAATGGKATGGAATGGGTMASGPWLPLPATNDAATLTGIAVGSCPPYTPLRRKKIPLVIDGGSSDFQIGDAYLLGDPQVPYIATLLAPVKNVGTALHCGITSPINGYDWLDPNGHSMDVTVGPGFIGSEGDVGTIYYDQTCLAPGETGFIIDGQDMESVTDLFATASTVTLALISTAMGTTPAAIVVPQSYMYKVVGASTDEIDVDFNNVGTAAAVMQSLDYGTVIAFDADGLPIWTTRLNDTADTPSDNPGYLAAGTAGLGDNLIQQAQYLACGASIRAFIKFEAPTAPWQKN